MNGRCESCDREAECAYPYKPTECCNYRKFRQREPLAEQVRDAQRTVANWSQKKRANVQLEGADLYVIKGGQP